VWKILLISAFTTIPIVEANAGTLATYGIANWSAGAYSNDQTGEFSHCAASIPYQSGITMGLSVGKAYNWSVAFINPVWKLTKGGNYTVSMSIDGGGPFVENAVAIAGEMAEISLPDSTTLFNAFRKGYQLKVNAASGTFYFNLTGTNAVLTSLLQCVKHYVAPPEEHVSSTQNPFLGTPTARTDAGDQNKAEAMALAANILSASGISGFHILTPAEMTPSARVDAAWRVGSVFGGVNVVPVSGGFRLQDYPPTAISDDARSCQGKFASGTLPDANNQIIRVFTSCDSGQSAFTAYYLFANRPAGGFFRFVTLVASTDDAPAQQADANIRQVVVKVLYEQ
jgi:hypothetical protein